MRWLLFVALVVVTVVFQISIGAFGQTFCTEREEILNRLAAEYGEELVEVEDFGLYGLLEVLVSRARGTWTAIVTKPGSPSCVLATGKGLRTDKYSLEATEYVL